MLISSNKVGVTGLLIVGGFCLGFGVVAIFLKMFGYGTLYISTGIITILLAINAPIFKSWSNFLATNHQKDGSKESE